MSNYPIYTIASAPEHSKSALEKAAAGIWCCSQHCRRHRQFTETRQLPGWRVSTGPQQQPY